MGQHQQEQNKGLIVFAVFSCVKCVCLGRFHEECKRSVTWIPIKVELDKLNGVLEQLCCLVCFFFLNLMRPNILSQPGAQDLQLKLSPVNEAFPVCLT